MLSSGRNIEQSCRGERPFAPTIIKKFSFAILLSLSMLLVAGALAGKADATPVTKYDVGNIDVYSQVLDSGMGFLLKYDPNAPQDSAFYGGSFDIFGLNYGGNVDSLTDGWFVDSIVTHANGSKDYHLRSMDSAANIGAQDVSFSLYFAPQNGSPVPQGLGSMPLDSLLNVQSGYAMGQNYQGSIGVPSPLGRGNS